MKDYKKILEGMVNIITSENSDVVANIRAYIDENCPELKEDEDERIIKALKEGFKYHQLFNPIFGGIPCKEIVNWLEKQGEQNHCMIQWKGDNLKEVLDFTGKDKNFEKWFKSFEEYEKYVQEHDGIFKLFNADGSHYEVPVGAWIVKTPDGYNVASKAIFRQKPADNVEPTDYNSIDPHFGKPIDKAELNFKSENCEKKSAWSEEDVDVMDTLIKYLTQECDKTTIPEDKEMFDREISMLKSLKDRVQLQNSWKPSEEQMNALDSTLQYSQVSHNSFEHLNSLYNELEKLKG